MKVACCWKSSEFAFRVPHLGLKFDCFCSVNLFDSNSLPPDMLPPRQSHINHLYMPDYMFIRIFIVTNVTNYPKTI